ncbi:MAG: DUF2281 domain-containing protein [Nostocales cyanobacterium]|nr:MAG: DUF2281 domain-containing protein [Nostocales cyanobacterium]TAF18481.1 MAG: DUF2281 domain-containing protein [Nostocales cyanobacterium]
MMIKETLIQEIESTPDNILSATLDFLRFLKAKENQSKAGTVTEPTQAKVNSQINSTGNSLLEHLNNIGKWEGDDLQECLNIVYATRGKVNFDENNPFE